MMAWAIRTHRQFTTRRTPDFNLTRDNLYAKAYASDSTCSLTGKTIYFSMAGGRANPLRATIVKLDPLHEWNKTNTLVVAEYVRDFFMGRHLEEVVDDLRHMVQKQASIREHLSLSVIPIDTTLPLSHENGELPLVNANTPQEEDPFQTPFSLE